MAGATSWYFAYASNMNSAQMRSRAGEIREERRARLENYELAFNKRARGGTAQANIRHAPGKAVEGVLYLIPEAAYRNLDRYEGAPEHYRRTEVTVVDAEGRRTPAQVFIATKVENGFRPAPHYLQAILQGAEEHGLSADYIQQIRAAASGD
jgi:cation transport regulator ChaC